MPNSPQTPCRHPGCGALVPSPGYCALHRRHTCRTAYDETTRRYVPRLAAAARFRSSARWQHARDWHRARHPLCCDPFGLHGDLPVPAAQVHHVEPVADRPDLACAESNLRSLCTHCHARIERIERNGDSTRALFVAGVTGGAR